MKEPDLQIIAKSAVERYSPHGLKSLNNYSWVASP
jgi:hypothetical protein